ncbi:hypothetical protein ABE096_13830 [Robertmurraya massiliosenegalensis]|uniref:hypothetical protein n=1 Tax=Robertmurraya TaxID=2837507 RepID=UPI0039A46C96
MAEVIKGRAMPIAQYKKGGTFFKIRAVDVDPKSKDKITFYCCVCKQIVIHTQGSKTKESKPFFRRSPGRPHSLDCPYAKKVTLEELKREIGTLDNLHYDIKTPLVIQQQSGDEGAQSSSKPKIEKTPTENLPTEIIKNPSKKHNKFIQTVDDLFHELADIENQSDFSIKKKLRERIYKKIYYPYSEYGELVRKNDDNTIKRGYFFISGKLFVNEWIKLKDEKKGYAHLFGKEKGIHLRIYPYNEKTHKKLLKITFNTKDANKKYEFIGVLASLQGIIKENEQIIIELTVYDCDHDQYRYNK